MICAFASSANAAPPDVSNIIASQRAGTKLVDITYDLVLDSGQTAFVELWFSPDNGLTFPVRCTAVSNDVNASVSPGTGKSVVWNAEADWDQQFTNNGKIRVIATYGNEASGFAGSGSVGGSGSAYVYGWCDDTFKEDMSKEEAQAWVTNAISLGIARDASSGGVIRLVTIDGKGCERKMLQPIEHVLCDDELPPVKRSVAST